MRSWLRKRVEIKIMAPPFPGDFIFLEETKCSPCLVVLTKAGPVCRGVSVWEAQDVEKGGGLISSNSLTSMEPTESPRFSEHRRMVCN